MDSETNPAKIAASYIGTTAELSILGSGIGGVVFLSPDLRTAVKVHHGIESFATEVKAYGMLGRARLARVHGLTIPRLHEYREDLRLISMDFVRPPFLLDFAGVRFSPPDFDADVWAHWHAKLQWVFSDNVHIIYDVYHTLSRLGIFYMDFRPTNIKLEGLPDYHVPAQDDDDLDDFNAF